MHYDFNFQQANHLNEEITVLPGDILLLHCYYNTTGRDGVTVGGESTSDEMCLAFPVYYPKVEMNGCVSQAAFDQIIPFVLQNVPPEDQEAFGALASVSLVKALKTLEWNEQQINNFEEKVYQSGLQSAYCYSDDDFNHGVEQVPDVCCYYNPPKPVRNCTLVETEQPGGASLTHISTGLLFLLLLFSIQVM